MKNNKTVILDESYEYRSVYVSDKGSSKMINQDAFASMQAISDAGLFKLVALCDGMGGLSEGEVASSHVINSLQNWFNHELVKLLDSTISIKRIGDELIKVINTSNRDIYEYAKNKQIQLGTTCSLIFIYNKSYIVIHIGDTRIYSYLNHQCKQLTKDHSLVEKLYEQGMLSKQEKQFHPQLNILTKCIGVFETIEPQIIYGQVLSQESFLLCCDGFIHQIDESELIEAMDEMMKTNYGNADQRLKSMIDLMRFRKEKDNISACIIFQERRGNYGSNW